MTSLAQPVQAVVTLFEGPLAGVRFADVDAGGLGTLAAEVTRAASELAQQEAALIALRQELAQRQEALLSLAQQALAYARIYAEGDEGLLAQLNDIALPRATKARKQPLAKPLAEEDAAAAQPATAERESAVTEPAEPTSEPLKTKPSYARPKIKRRLGRAAAQSDSDA